MEHHMFLVLKNVDWSWWWIVFVVWLTDKRRSLISSRDHCQRSSPSRISDTPRAEFEPAQSLSSGFGEWSWVVAITTTPRRHYTTAPLPTGDSSWKQNFNSIAQWTTAANFGRKNSLQNLLTYYILATRRSLSSEPLNYLFLYLPALEHLQ